MTGVLNNIAVFDAVVRRHWVVVDLDETQCNGLGVVGGWRRTLKFRGEQTENGLIDPPSFGTRFVFVSVGNDVAHAIADKVLDVLKCNVVASGPGGAKCGGGCVFLGLPQSLFGTLRENVLLFLQRQFR